MNPKTVMVSLTSYDVSVKQIMLGKVPDPVEGSVAEVGKLTSRR